MKDWKECTLEDIAFINPREVLPKGTQAKKIPMEFLIPYTKKIAGYLLELYQGGTKFRNEDTLVSRITPCLENGKIAFVNILDEDELAFGSTEYIVLRSKKGKSDSNFIYYFATSNEFRDLAILSMTGSSGRQRVQIDVLKNHVFLLPPLKEQQAIAKVLSELDNKIELLHQQNQTLESLAETLFRQWFIEDPNEDWQTGKLPDEFNFTMGQSPVGTSFNEDFIGVPMYQGNADFGFRFPCERIYTTQPTRFAYPLDTLISVRAPVGEQNMALVKCCIGRGVAAFRYKFDENYYTYTYFKIRSLMAKIKQFNDEGTVFGSIGKKDFEALDIIIPPNKLIQKFENNSKPMNDKIIENCKQIRTLEALRDSLLPKLISGEIRLPSA